MQDRAAQAARTDHAGHAHAPVWPRRIIAAARRHPAMVVWSLVVMAAMPIAHALAEPRGLEGLEGLIQVGLAATLLLGLLILDARSSAMDAQALTEIAASEERFRSMAEHSQDISFRYRIDPPGFEYLSPSWEDVTGMPAAVAIADRSAALALVDPADMPRLDGVMTQGTDPETSVEIRVRRADGTARVAEFRSTVIRDGTGRPTHTLGTGRDVTERANAEQRLQESERRFREMADRSRDIIFRYQLRPDPGFLYISQSVERLVGAQPSSAYLDDATLIERSVHPDDRFLLASLFTSTMPTDDPVICRWMDEAGIITWVEITVVPVLGEDGYPDAIDGVARVVTDRIRAQEALARSEGRFREMLANLDQLALILDAGARCLFANSAVARLAGRTGDAMIGQDVIRLLAPAQYAEEARGYLGALLAGLDIPKQDSFVRAADGVDHVIRWDWIVLHDDSGRPTALAAIGEDVTDARQMASDRDRLQSVIERTEDGIAIVDADGMVSYANPAMLARLGAAREVVVGRPAAAVLPELLGAPWPMAPHAQADGPWRAERRNVGDAGSPVVEELTITPVADEQGRTTHHVVEVWDTTRVHELEWAVTRASQERAAVSAALMHLDHHGTLEATADAITGELLDLPGIDAAAILAFDLPSGGHVVASHGIPGMETGTTATEQAIGYVRDRVVVGPFTERWTRLHPHQGRNTGEPVLIAVGCGPIVADGRVVGLLMMATADPDHVERLLGDHATLGEFSAISSVLLGGAMRAEQERSLTRRHVERVIREQRFEIGFQPIVDVASGRYVGFESLPRFLDDVDPLISVALADTVGLGRALESAVLSATIERARDLPADAWLSLDLTMAMMIVLGEHWDLLRTAERSIVVELSEHELIADYMPLRAALEAAGPTVRLAIDDTGAGAANLAHLVELRPEFVKLDASLIRDLDTDVTRQAMARGILQFASATGSTVIAAGVARAAELDALRRLGIGLAQGDLFGRAETAATWA